MGYSRSTSRIYPIGLFSLIEFTSKLSTFFKPLKSTIRKISTHCPSIQTVCVKRHYVFCRFSRIIIFHVLVIRFAKSSMCKTPPLNPFSMNKSMALSKKFSNPTPVTFNITSQLNSGELKQWKGFHLWSFKHVSINFSKTSANNKISSFSNNDHGSYPYFSWWSYSRFCYTSYDLCHW